MTNNTPCFEAFKNLHNLKKNKDYTVETWNFDKIYFEEENIEILAEQFENGFNAAANHYKCFR